MQNQWTKSVENEIEQMKKVNRSLKINETCGICDWKNRCYCKRNYLILPDAVT